MFSQSGQGRSPRSFLEGRCLHSQISQSVSQYLTLNTEHKAPHMLRALTHTVCGGGARAYNAGITEPEGGSQVVGHSAPSPRGSRRGPRCTRARGARAKETVINVCESIKGRVCKERQSKLGKRGSGPPGAPDPWPFMESVSYTHLTLPTNREV